MLWDIKGKIIDRWDITHITSICIDSTGEYICVVSGEKTIQILNLIDKTTVTTYIENDAIVDMCASKSHPELMVTYHSNEIRVLHLLTGKVIGKYTSHNHGKYVVQGSFGGNNDCFIATGSTDGKIYVWSRSKETLIQVLEVHEYSPVACVLWNPVDNDMFASASDDGMLCLWGNK